MRLCEFGDGERHLDAEELRFVHDDDAGPVFFHQGDELGGRRDVERLGLDARVASSGRSGDRPEAVSRAAWGCLAERR